ncbi:MAG: leucine-rich repeat protein [Bacteroidaceae bacterium]|nr:leucine-rich repeat protein [Bacteroidaceae bacterium]
MKTLRLFLSLLLLCFGGISATLLAQSYYSQPDFIVNGVGYCRYQTRDFTADGVTIVSIPSGISDFTLPSEITFDEEHTVNGYTYTVTKRYPVYGVGFFAQLVGDGPGNYQYAWEEVDISSQNLRTLRVNRLMNGGFYLNKISLPYLHNVYFASGTLPPTNNVLSYSWYTTHVYNALEPNIAAWREKGADIVLELNADNSYTENDITYYLDKDNRSAYVYSIGGNNESITIPNYITPVQNQAYYSVVALGVPGFKMQSTNNNLKALTLSSDVALNECEFASPLKDLYFRGDLPSTPTVFFNGQQSNLTLHAGPDDNKIYVWQDVVHEVKIDYVFDEDGVGYAGSHIMAFEGTKTSITIPGSVTVGSAYLPTTFTDNKLEELTFESSAQFKNANFGGCSKLENMTFNDNVSFDEATSFTGCNTLREISFGAGVTGLSGKFANVPLTKIVFQGNIPSLSGSASNYASVPGNVDVYVNADQAFIDQLLTQSPWKDFKSVNPWNNGNLTLSLTLKGEKVTYMGENETMVTLESTTTQLQQNILLQKYADFSFSVYDRFGSFVRERVMVNGRDITDDTSFYVQGDGFRTYTITYVKENTYIDVAGLYPWMSLAFHSTQAGTFAQTVANFSESQKRQLRGLVISGEINSTDLREIRNLCGVPFTWSTGTPPSTGYNVSYLDLSKATFVAGGQPFMRKVSGNNVTDDYYAPNGAFTYLAQVDTLWIPSSLGGFSMWDFTNSNPSMVIYTLRNETTFVTTMEQTSSQQTLVVPKGRTEYYSGKGFGTVVDGGYDGVGTITPAKPDFVTLNICRGNGDAEVVLKYNKKIDGEVQDYIETIPVGSSTIQISHEDLYQAWDGSDYYPTLELGITSPNNRSVRVFCNGTELTEVSSNAIDDTHAYYSFISFNFERYYVNNTSFERNIDIQFGDAIVSEVRTMRFRSNSVNQDVSVYMYNKNSEGNAIASSAEPLAKDVFHSVPVTKIVQMLFPVSSGNPNETGSLMLNGVPVEGASYSWEGHNWQYEVNDLTTQEVWDFLLDVRHAGEPDPNKVTHYVLLADDSGMSTVTFNYTDEAGNVYTNQVKEGTNIFEMDKVTMNENTYVDLSIKVPADYQLSLYNSLVPQQVEQEGEPSIENGVEFVTYRWHKTDYEFRMVNQSLSIVVSAPDPTMNMDVMLLGNAMAVFKPKTGNGTELEPQYVNESGSVQLNGKAQQMELVVGVMEQVGNEFWTNNQLVVKADGQDVSSLFSTTPEWHGNNQGFITTTPISGELLKAKNWVIGFKDQNSNIVTHRATIIGEIDDNVVLIQWMSAQGILDDYQIDANTPTNTSISDESPIACRPCVTLADGYTFKAFFNGQELTGFTKDAESVWSATFSDPATTDGVWIFEFAKKPSEIIHFADAEVKRICVGNWDTDGDGELSMDEAAAVETLLKDNGSGTLVSVFRNNSTITSFDEFQYFTGLTSVEDHAFSYCNKLSSVIVPRNVTTIEQAAFSGCGYLSIVLPDGITSIGSDGFRNCVFMKEISLPESLTNIGSSAFAGCISLNTLYIPKNLTSIGYQALSNLKGLLSLVVDPANTKYSSPNGCNAVIITASNTMLAGCQNTNLPEGVKVINGLYNQDRLQSFVIPSSVTTIVESAFYNCSQLKSVVSKIENPENVLGTGAFTGIHADCVLWVPYGKKTAYRDAGWGDGQGDSPAIFKEIKELPSRYDVNVDGSVSIADVTKLVNVILGKED